MSQLIKKQKHDCPTEVVCLRAQHTDCSCLWLLSRVLFMILAGGLGDTRRSICNTHPGEDDTKNVMWCYKLNNYCPGIWWGTLLMLSAKLFSSVFKVMQWKTVLTQRIFYAHLVGIFFLSWGWKSITILLVCIIL